MVMHLSTFSSSGGVGGGGGGNADHPVELNIFENWLSNSQPMSHKFVSKTRWALKFCI